MKLTEQEIINLITLGQKKAPDLYGVGDDGAAIRNGMVVVQDSMLEGVHFDERLSPADVGWKIVAVNVSDIAAMGRLPDWATLSMSLPETTDREWVVEFAKGMRKAMKTWNISLIGGDTTRSKYGVVISMAMGSRKGSSIVWRSGAQVGDDVWVTGQLGNAAFGFFNKDNAVGIEHLRRPNPPLRFAAAISSFKVVNSMTDISDGLHTDLKNICHSSGVGASIDPDSIPKGSQLWQEKDALAYATAFGEDYEMLFTCTQGVEQIIRQTARLQKVKVSKIGTIIPDPNRIELHKTNWPPTLFEHF
jgi:thiamine-monophosphate kinase